MRDHRGWRRRPLPVLAGALALVAAIAVPTSASMSSEGRPAAVEKSTFEVGHLNIKRGMSHERFVHDLDRITSRAAMVGLNEVADKRGFLKDWAQRNGWHFYAPDPRWAGDNALLAKKSKFDVVNKGMQRNCEGHENGHPRYTTWVRYRHEATGRNIFHINMHAISRIERHGHPRDNDRVTCAKGHFRDVRDLAKAKKRYGQVILTGDLNVDFVADKREKHRIFPYTVLDERDSVKALPGLRSSYATLGVKGSGTHSEHGNRHIDYVYFWKRTKQAREMWMTKYRIVGRTFSDHKGLVAKFAIASRPEQAPHA